MENQLFQLPILQFYTNQWAIIWTMLLGHKNPHSPAFVKIWGFLHFGSHIAAAEKTHHKRAETTVHKQWSQTTENACVKCGIVYHNSFTFRVRKLYVSGQILLKRHAFLRFYQENILTKARACVIIFSASDTRSFAVMMYLGV